MARQRSVDSNSTVTNSHTNTLLNRYIFQVPFHSATLPSSLTFKTELAFFINLCHTWTGPQPTANDLGESLEHPLTISSSVDQPHGTTPWPVAYWDNHALRPIIKVDSHQLNHDGSVIVSCQRYPVLVPNLALLNANHWADRVADLPISHLTQTSPSSFMPPTQNQHPPQQPPNVRLPLGLLRFKLSYSGALLDKAIPPFVNICFENELLKRARSKAAQGLIYRLIEHCVPLPLAPLVASSSSGNLSPANQSHTPT